MEPFTTHRGRAALLDWSDVNTDLIIPARYLKRVERTGYGPLLFADKRYEPGGAPEPEDPDRHGALDPTFPLNRPEAEGASILVVGRNFGCGSSREHAVWAVAQAGFRALIAPVEGEGFADIFEANAYNNGLLPIELPIDQWQAIADRLRRRPGLEMTVNLLENRIVPHETSNGAEPVFPFRVPEAQRERLLSGLDPIGETLRLEPEIAAHEGQAPFWAARPAASATSTN